MNNNLNSIDFSNKQYCAVSQYCEFHSDKVKSMQLSEWFSGEGFDVSIYEGSKEIMKVSFSTDDFHNLAVLANLGGYLAVDLIEQESSEAQKKYNEKQKHIEEIRSKFLAE